MDKYETFKRNTIHAFLFDGSNWTKRKYFHFTICHIVINFSIRWKRLLFMSFKSLLTFFFDFNLIANDIFWMFHSFIFAFSGLKDSRSFYERDLSVTIPEKRHQPKLLHFDYITKTISDIILFIYVFRVQVHVSVPTAFEYLLIVRTQKPSPLQRIRKNLKLLCFYS